MIDGFSDEQIGGAVRSVAWSLLFEAGGDLHDRTDNIEVGGAYAEAIYFTAVDRSGETVCSGKVSYKDARSCIMVGIMEKNSKD